MNSDDREKTITITANTTAGEIILDMQGEKQTDIVGVFGGGTINIFSFTNKGRGAILRGPITVADSYEDHAQRTEVVLTGATNPVLSIIQTPIPSLSVR